MITVESNLLEKITEKKNQGNKLAKKLLNSASAVDELFDFYDIHSTYIFTGHRFGIPTRKFALKETNPEKIGTSPGELGEIVNEILTTTKVISKPYTHDQLKYETIREDYDPLLTEEGTIHQVKSFLLLTAGATWPFISGFAYLFGIDYGVEHGVINPDNASKGIYVWGATAVTGLWMLRREFGKLGSWGEGRLGTMYSAACTADELARIRQ